MFYRIPLHTVSVELPGGHLRHLARVDGPDDGFAKVEPRAKVLCGAEPAGLPPWGDATTSTRRLCIHCTKADKRIRSGR